MTMCDYVRPCAVICATVYNIHEKMYVIIYVIINVLSKVGCM